MKINRLIIFLYVSCIFSQHTTPECLGSFFNKNKNILNNSNVYLIKAIRNDINEDSIIIYIEKNKRFRIEYDDQIIISDTSRIIHYKGKTNQLFIEKKDTFINNLVFSFGDSLKFINSLNNYVDYKKINFFYNKDCHYIDSIIVSNNDNYFKLSNLTFDMIKLEDLDIFFKLNIDENNVFKYDFR